MGCALKAIYGRCHLGLPNSSFLTSLFSRLAGLAVVIRSVIGVGRAASSVVGTRMLMKGHPDHDREMDALLTDPGPRPLGGLVASRHVRSRYETVVGWTAIEGDFFLRIILVSWLQLYLGMFFTMHKSNFLKLLTSKLFVSLMFPPGHCSCCVLFLLVWSRNILTLSPSHTFLFASSLNRRRCGHHLPPSGLFRRFLCYYAVSRTQKQIHLNVSSNLC